MKCLIRHLAVLFVGSVFIFTCVAIANDGGSSEKLYASGYFGEQIGGLSQDEESSFFRGFALFVQRFDQGSQYARNASSCVTCHSVPMPGGSGMAAQAEVKVRLTDTGRTEIIQSLMPGGKNPTDGDQQVRRTPALFGLGFIEFSQARWTSAGRRPIFGAFAEHDSLKEFVSQAFATELGVSSPSACARASVTTSYPDECSPVLTDGQIDDVVTFIRFLSAPPRHAGTSLEGQKIFQGIGCGTCHVQVVRTTSDAPEPLRDKQVAAYTDTSVHDLGFERPLKTAPLWALNSFGPPYMHDAKAGSIEAAVLEHGGEADPSRKAFVQLSQEDKNRLLTFLKSL